MASALEGPVSEVADIRPGSASDSRQSEAGAQAMNAEIRSGGTASGDLAADSVEWIFPNLFVRSPVRARSQGHCQLVEVVDQPRGVPRAIA